MHIYFNMKSIGKINISMKDKEACGFFSDYPYFCVTKQPRSNQGVNSSLGVPKGDWATCVFHLGKKSKLRLYSFEPNFTTFLMDNKHFAVGRNPRVSCSVCSPSHAEELTWVIEGLFSFPFLASVSSPFNEENRPFLFLPRWVSESVLFRKAESSLEHT